MYKCSCVEPQHSHHVRFKCDFLCAENDSLECLHAKYAEFHLGTLEEFFYWGHMTMTLFPISINDDKFILYKHTLFKFELFQCIMQMCSVS